MVLNITVKTLDSQNYQFEANDDWTVQQFKEHIQPTINVSSTEQRLIFCGRVLQDDKKLTDYDCSGKVIHLVRRPPPSLDNPSSSTADSNNNSNNYHEGSMDHNRFLSEGNVLISAIALGPETINMNINHFGRDPTRRADHPIILRATATTNHGTSTSTDTSTQQRDQNNQPRETSRSNQTLEGSVTITTTTVETTPAPIASFAAPSMRPLVDATLVVTSDPGQPPMRIPIPVPIPLGSHGSISMEFRPTTNTTPREAESSTTTQADSEQGTQSATPTEQSSNSQNTTTSNSTQTAPRVDVIPGRIPLPFNYLLLCFSQWGNFGTTTRTTATRPGEAPTTRIQLRTVRQQSAPGSNQQANPPTANSTAPTPPTAVHSSSNRETAPALDAGLTEVVSNIVGSFFRPPQRSQNSAQQGSNTNFNQDPLLNIIPELAINAASQILGGVLGIPAGSQTATSNHASNRPAQASSSSNTVMMDIDIDDSSSSQSESRYQDARESHSPMTSSSNAQTTCRPSSSQHATQSEARRSALESTSSNSSMSYSRQQLIEVMQNHPDWIPIIEADITFMEQQQRTSNNRPVFSDAYLSSIPRKRRRLLTASSDQVFILQPSPSQAINNLLRRAISSSSLQSIDSLDRLLGTISSDANLQSAYEDHIKSLVERRLRSDYDYSPSKFENSSKYFK